MLSLGELYTEGVVHKGAQCLRIGRPRALSTSAQLDGTRVVGHFLVNDGEPASPPDAGVATPDAGPHHSDAAVLGDASVTDGASLDATSMPPSSGGCRVTPADRTSSAPLLLAAMAMLLLRRRSRFHGRRTCPLTARTNQSR